MLESRQTNGAAVPKILQLVFQESVKNTLYLKPFESRHDLCLHERFRYISPLLKAFCMP